jgi:hypothetical protein
VCACVTPRWYLGDVLQQNSGQFRHLRERQQGLESRWGPKNLAGFGAVTRYVFSSEGNTQSP